MCDVSWWRLLIANGIPLAPRVHQTGGWSVPPDGVHQAYPSTSPLTKVHKLAFWSRRERNYISELRPIWFQFSEIYQDVVHQSAVNVTITKVLTMLGMSCGLFRKAQI